MQCHFPFSTKTLSLSFMSMVILISSIHTTEEAEIFKLPKNETFLAVHAFGDSVLDTGNNNNLKTIAKCNFAPYGRDFKEGRSTGRFCNGKITSDFIAEALGIKEEMPSYHDPNLQSKDLQTGLSFASGGSGYDPLTSQLLQVFSQSEQLEFFKEYARKLKGEVGEERSRTIIARSLYLLSSGHNDILLSYFATQLRKLHYDVPSYTDLLLRWASNFLRGLYKLGARKIAVFNVAPLGCLPFARTLGGGIDRKCAEKINQAVQMFNAKLSSEIDSLNHELHDSNFLLIDIYNPLLDIIHEPSKFGYEIVGKGCCSTGIVETGIFCNKLVLVHVRIYLLMCFGIPFIPQKELTGSFHLKSLSNWSLISSFTLWDNNIINFGLLVVNFMVSHSNYCLKN